MTPQERLKEIETLWKGDFGNPKYMAKNSSSYKKWWLINRVKRLTEDMKFLINNANMDQKFKNYAIEALKKE